MADRSLASKVAVVSGAWAHHLQEVRVERVRHWGLLLTHLQARLRRDARLAGLCQASHQWTQSVSQDRRRTWMAAEKASAGWPMGSHCGPVEAEAEVEMVREGPASEVQAAELAVEGVEGV